MHKAYFLSVLFLFLCIDCLAQKDAQCSSITYTDKNQVTPDSVAMKKVRGRIITHDDVPFIDGCVGLFREDDKRLVKVLTPNRKGEFQFDNIPNGRYRLVVKHIYNFYCVANISVEVGSDLPRKRSLSVVMQPEGIDECSHFRLKS